MPVLHYTVKLGLCVLGCSCACVFHLYSVTYPYLTMSSGDGSSKLYPLHPSQVPRGILCCAASYLFIYQHDYHYHLWYIHIYVYTGSFMIFLLTTQQLTFHTLPLRVRYWVYFILWVQGLIYVLLMQEPCYMHYFVIIDFAVMRLYDIYVYIISVWRRHQNISPFTDSRVNANYEQIASWAACIHICI